MTIDTGSDSVLFQLPKGCYLKDGEKRTQLTAFTLRETDGNDEENAANTAKAKGGSATSLEELVQLSLVEVNGDPVNVGKPYTAFMRWNSRARQFAVRAWNAINSIDKEEGDAFLAQASLGVSSAEPGDAK